MRYSVLLPTRNGGQFLRNCIKSMLSQGYDDFELVEHLIETLRGHQAGTFLRTIV